MDLEFFIRNNPDGSSESVEEEDFFEFFENCQAADGVREFIKALGKDKVFEIQEITLEKSRYSGPATYVLISTLLATYIVTMSRGDEERSKCGCRVTYNDEHRLDFYNCSLVSVAF